MELELELVSSYEGKRWETRREEVSALGGREGQAGGAAKD